MVNEVALSATGNTDTATAPTLSNTAGNMKEEEEVAVLTSSDTVYYGTILDIVKSPEEAVALEAMLSNAPAHSYIKPEIINVNWLKVYILDASDDSVIEYMKMATNANGPAYKTWLYAGATPQSPDKAADPVSLSKRASGCGR